jgi:glycosyltransferase involved in cell wall biosynthesis
MRYWGGERKSSEGGIHFCGVCSPMPLYNSSGRRSIIQALYFSAKLLPSLMLAKFDLIDCNQFPYLPMFTAKIVSVIRRKPLIVTWHEVWCGYWTEYLGPLGFFGQLTEWLASKLPDKIIAVSEKTKRGLIELGVPEKKIVVIPNGVNASEVESAPTSQKKYDILYAGRLARHKNVDLLIEAAATLSEASTLIVGEGPDRKRLVELAETKGILDYVEFRDFVDPKTLYGIIKSSRVFVLPSSREGFGISALEANAASVPVVTVRHKNNAAADLIEDGVNGFVAEFNAGSIAAKINEILRREPGYYARTCRMKARGYGWDKISDETEKIYREVAGLA